MHRFFVLSLAFLGLAACATPTNLAPTDGSRADGTIELSYEHGEFQKTQIDSAHALTMAKERCAAWGYSGAEPFGGQQTRCTMPGGFTGCVRYLVTMRYQCLGDLEK